MRSSHRQPKPNVFQKRNAMTDKDYHGTADVKTAHTIREHREMEQSAALTSVSSIGCLNMKAHATDVQITKEGPTKMIKNV